MSIILLILKILLYVLLGVLCLLAVLLMIPVTASVRFRQGVLSLAVRYLFIKFQVLPSRKKSESEQDDSVGKPGEQLHEDAHTDEAVEEETTELSFAPADDNTSDNELDEQAPESFSSGDSGSGEQQSQQDSDKRNEKLGEKKDSLTDLWRRIRPLLDPTKKAVISLCHRIHIRKIEIVYNVRGSDAARVGMLSGAAWAIIGELMRLLHLVFGKNVEYKEITVYPCFDPDDGADERFGCEITVTPIIIVLIAVCFGFRYLKEKLTSKE